MTRQLLDSFGPIPNKTPNQTLEAIQTMVDHSQKWHDGSNSRKVSNGSSDRIATIVNKLDSLGYDMKKLKENMHAMQVRRDTIHVFDNRPPFDEKRPNLKELMNKHLKESTRRRADMEDWMKKLQESTNMNIRNQNASLKNLETQVEQLTKDYQAKDANEVPNSSIGQFKEIFADNEAPRDETSSNGTNELHRVFFISDDNMQEWEDKIMFDINENIHHPTVPIEKVYMANSVQEEESFNPLEKDNSEDEKGRQRWLNLEQQL
ncbi:hypothetical protein Tco_0999310 [Tanacetum coccineum]